MLSSEWKVILLLRKLWRLVSPSIEYLHRQCVHIPEDRLLLQPVRYRSMNGDALDLSEAKRQIREQHLFRKVRAILPLLRPRLRPGTLA